MIAISQMKNWPVARLSFTMNGKKIEEKETPKSLKLMDQTVIDCELVPQVAVKDTTLTIRVKDQSGDETFFKVKKSTKMANIFRAYAQRKGVEYHVLYFLLDGTRIDGEETPSSLELEEDEQIDCLLNQYGDIGIFGKYINSIGIEHLTVRSTTGSTTNSSTTAASAIIQHLKANPKAIFTNETKQILMEAQRNKLTTLLNQKWNGKDQDFKLQLSNTELAQIIGQTSYEQLVTQMDGTHDTILLRRCMQHGKVIKFHVDHGSYKTLQVPLNDNYIGGRLVYATEKGLMYPERNPGSFTKHTNDIAHGVTCLKSGIRYGLFFLQKKLSQ